MLPSNIELLKHIVDEFVINDPILSRAIIRSLEIIGEAATKLDPDFKSMYPHIEWRKMSNTRHRLIHDYFGVDYDIVWNVVETKLPDLELDIRSIIADEH